MATIWIPSEPGGIYRNDHSPCGWSVRCCKWTNSPQTIADLLQICGPADPLKVCNAGHLDSERNVLLPDDEGQGQGQAFEGLDETGV
jgi:hypothetical protein